MSRDVLTASLRALTVQAEAITAQLSVTHAVAEELATASITSEALQRRLTAAAEAGLAAEVERALAESDHVNARRHADRVVEEALAWRRSLRDELDVLRAACPPLTHDAQTLLLLTRERPRRLPAMVSWITSLEGDLIQRAAVFKRLPEGAQTVLLLQQVARLRVGLEEASQRVNTAREVRAKKAEVADAARTHLQKQLRLARAGWALAQTRRPFIPDLDLTVVRGAVGRTTGRRRSAKGAATGDGGAASNPPAEDEGARSPRSAGGDAAPPAPGASVEERGSAQHTQ